MRHVLCFGDSNTHGTPALAEPWRLARLPETQRWPSVAAEALGAGWRLLAEGQPGRTTVHPDPVEGGHKAGIAVLPVLLESHRPLDAVVVLIGTNDFKHRFAATAVDVALALDRLAVCVAQSDAGPDGAPPYCLVVAPPPIAEIGAFAEVFRGGAEKSRQLGSAAAAVTRRRGTPFLDAGAIAAVDPVDGIHLDAAAHAAIGRAVAQRLKDMLE